MSTDKEITLEDVRHMAMLSRLVVESGEEVIFARQFAQILGHMGVLEGVDTAGIDPMYNPVPHAAPTREDIAGNLRTRKEILANAPETDGETFIVPRIV